MRPLSPEGLGTSYARTSLLRAAEVSKPLSAVQRRRQEDCGDASQTDGAWKEDHGAGAGQTERPICVRTVPSGRFPHGRDVPAKTHNSGLAFLRTFGHATCLHMSLTTPCPRRFPICASGTRTRRPDGFCWEKGRRQSCFGMATPFMVHIPACTAPRVLIDAMALFNGKDSVTSRNISRQSKHPPVTEV